MRWSIVIPVKRLAVAKSRLSPPAGLRRAELALAVACDTVRAVVDCASVAAVIVVTDDETAASVLAGYGAHVVADGPNAGLNPALVHGAEVAATRRPGTAIGALSADLPALRSHELARVLHHASRVERAFLADASGVGTTIYTALRHAVFRPAFGGRSCRRHRDSGAVELTIGGVDTVRRDVDTVADLRAADTLGLGPRTRAVVRGRSSG